jgi:hypothetical protein
MGGPPVQSSSGSIGCVLFDAAWLARFRKKHLEIRARPGYAEDDEFMRP